MEKRSSFGSRFGVVAAVGGSVVGLGNIWRFPYIAGENGGGAFILVYFIISLAIAVPILLSEFTIGRRARSNARRAFTKIRKYGKWGWVGYLGIATAFVIMSFYSVIAGWSLEFLFSALFEGFTNITSAEMGDKFSLFVGGAVRPLIWTITFILLAVFIISAGVEKGIERYNKIFMPLLLVLMIMLAVNSLTLPGAKEGLSFLLKPDFSKIHPSTLLQALGQSFFSLSLGLGAMITYGSYIKADENMFKVGGMVAISDISIAILSGIVIFPAVFSYGISPTSGPDLVFITMPVIFGQMTGGYFIAILFFFLLFLAAITSIVSLFEVVTAYLTEEKNLSRKRAARYVAVALTITGSMCVLSQGDGTGFRIAERSLFDWCDTISATVMMPVGGLLIVFFAGWVMKKEVFRNELTSEGRYGKRIFPLLYTLIRFVIPIVIAILFLDQIGLLKLVK